MGEVVVLFKVMPEGPETDLDALQDGIREAIDVEGIETEEVAFGLKAINVTTILEDAEGGTDPTQNALEGVTGVGSVELQEMNRL